ncbi:MAG: hypothetical protein ABJG78_04190 [Cyclobacteriaceae bacterium]
MRQLSIFSVLLVLSCTPKQDRIIVPKVGNDFYTQALLRIDDDLQGDVDNIKLVEQKLYYCDLLDWPSTCVSALDELKRQKGMTPQLLEQYVIYFEKHQQYQQLLEVIERWGAEFNLSGKYKRQKVLGLLKTSRRAECAKYLQGYMVGKTSAEDIAFAGECYVELGDTLMATYYLGKLSDADSTSELVLEVYPYMLFELGFEDKAFDLLERKSLLVPGDYAFHSDLATRYERSGLFTNSRDKLKNFTTIDSVVYRVADLYLLEEQWDSAHQYIDLLIDRDSLNRDAWFKKATMYEDRGWLSYSLNYFDHVVYLNPNDTIAVERAALVRRKIAYLQRLRFEENLLPPPVLKSKKIINNE